MNFHGLLTLFTQDVSYPGNRIDSFMKIGRINISLRTIRRVSIFERRWRKVAVLFCLLPLLVAAPASASFIGHWDFGSEEKVTRLITERKSIESHDQEGAAALDLAIYHAVRAQPLTLQKPTDIPNLAVYVDAQISEVVKADIMTAITQEGLRNGDFDALAQAQTAYRAGADTPLRRYTLAYNQARLFDALDIDVAAIAAFTEILGADDYQSLPHFERDYADILVQMSGLYMSVGQPVQSFNYARDAALSYHSYAGKAGIDRAGTARFRSALNLSGARAQAANGHISTAVQKVQSVLIESAEAGDKASEIEAQLLLGMLANEKGDYNTALSIFSDVLASPYFDAYGLSGARVFEGRAAAYEGLRSPKLALKMYKLADARLSASEKETAAKRGLYLAGLGRGEDVFSQLSLGGFVLKQGEIASHSSLNNESASDIKSDLVKTGARFDALSEPKLLSLIGLCFVLMAFALFWFIRSRRASAVLAQTTLNLNQSQSRERQTAKKARADLISAQSANDAKTAFLTNISHEIRTPMNGVLGLADALRRTQPLASQQKEIADTIYTSSQEMLALLGGVLDYSKIESGTFELRNEDANVRVMVENVATLMSGEARKKGLNILTRYAHDAPEVLNVDIGRLRQVLLNLVGNGIKFTEKGYVLINVNVEVFEDVATLKIDVLDTGTGIEESDIDVVFDDFVQLEQGRSKRYGGTGLGLSIAKKLVTVMGGELSARSKVGKGSVFSIQTETRTVKAASGAVSVDAGRPFLSGRVLLIDDFTPRLKIMSAQLKHWGLACTVARRASEGISGLLYANESGQEFDAVVLNRSMLAPNDDFIGMLKEHGPISGTPVILLDDFSNPEGLQDTDFSAHVAKPVRSKLFLEALKSVIAPKPQPRKTSSGGAQNTRRQRSHPVAKPRAVKPKKHRILVAETNAETRHIMEGFLTAENVQIHCVETGKQALDSAMTMDFDLIFMDVQLKKIDGFLVTRAIRAHEKENAQLRTPIICLSSFALGADKDLATAVGMDDFLVKPLSHDSLDIMMNKWAGIKNDVRDSKKLAKKAAQTVQVKDPMVTPLNLQAKIKPIRKAS